MNQALQSYTPTAHPLNYDALASREGCGPEIGNPYFGLTPFNNLCVFLHNSNDPKFNQPNKDSYQVGPTVTGQPGKQMTVWKASISSQDVRVGIVGKPDSLSGLFPQVSLTAAVKITHAFNSSGLLAIAVENTPAFVQAKWYKSTDPTIPIGSVSFTGNAPMMINLGNIDPSAGVVLFYLRPEIPYVLFARFSEEDYGTERIVMPAMRVNIVQLLSIRSIGGIIRLYGIDEQGRDVTLHAPQGSMRSTDSGKVSVGFMLGTLSQIASSADVFQDKAKLSCGFIRAFILDGTAGDLKLPDENSTLSVGLEQGDMNPYIAS